MKPIRVDYIHQNERASLGLAVLCRCPLALLPQSDRPDNVFEKYLPRYLTLAQAADEIAKGGA